MRRALTCGGVRSPPSAPQGWGSGLGCALGSGSATRKYHLRRRFTSSRPDVGCEFRGGEWARQQHASAASSSFSASTSSSCSGGDTRRAPRKDGRRGGAGRGGGDPAAAHGWGSECAGLGGGLFPGRWGRGGGVSESVPVGRGPDFLLPLPPRAEVAVLPFSSAPPLHEEAPGVRGRPGSLLPFPLRSSSGGGRTTGLAGWALTSATPPSSLTLSAFPLGPDARPRARTYAALRESRRWQPPQSSKSLFLDSWLINTVRSPSDVLISPPDIIVQELPPKRMLPQSKGIPYWFSF
ncbi:zinc finger X-linked protein ZXDB-like [Bos indicus]|uniref:Zinc finger X-linked protein ZXDB-like n=1 Tax=Bos indicus TaxID=9915 RepID=A0ABM4S606_BOSIN